MKAKQIALAAVAALSLGLAHAETLDSRSIQGWVAHADAVLTGTRGISTIPA